MQRVPQLPVFTLPPTQAEINAWLADEQRWFERGSVLWHASQNLLNNWNPGPTLEILVIGKPAMRHLSHEQQTSPDVDIVSEMLYAMAVECWLKGLYLMSQPRRSRNRKAKIDRFVQENLQAWNDTAQLYEQLNTILGTHPARLHTKRLEAETEAENKARVGLFDDHRRHNLQKLASSAGVKVSAKADRDYLDFLSKAIMLGRYPALFEANRAVPWVDLPRQSIRKDRINAAIFERYTSLEKVPF